MKTLTPTRHKPSKITFKSAMKRINSKKGRAELHRKLKKYEYKTSVKIGVEVVHTEQIDAAVACVRQFINRQGPPLLISPMQGGKTGVGLYVAFLFNELYGSYGPTEIIFLQNISEVSLKTQTYDRIEDSDMIKQIRCIHHAELNKEKPTNNVLRLIVIDECHIALAKSTSASLKPFNEYTKRCGIKYARPICEWPSQSTFVLSVSATPFGHAIRVVRDAIDQKCFQPIILATNKNYYSIADLRNDKRIHETSFLIGAGDRPTRFMVERNRDFLDSCKKNGNGYMVLRCRGDDNVSAITKFIEKDGSTVCIEYNHKKKNISEINNKLKKQPPRPTVIIIRGALRAGKTLDTLEFIRMWVDNMSNKADTVCQSIGRILGYGKRGNKFPVYCNTKELALVEAFYNDMSAIPSGVQNTSSHKSKVIQKRKLFTFTAPIFTGDVRNNSPHQRLLKKRIMEQIKGHYQEISETKEQIITRLKKLTVSKNSQANHQSYANLLMNQTVTGDSSISGTGSEGRGMRIFVMDGPNKNHQGDWDKLLKHPEYSKLVKKYFFYLDVPGESVRTTEKVEGPTISEKSLLHNKHK